MKDAAKSTETKEEIVPVEDIPERMTQAEETMR